MPYINVDEAYILDNTGLQVDQSVDYANANSNRNLLDNPWWGSGEVVNQRSVTTKPSSNNVYTIDRWLFSSGADANNWSVGSSGIAFTISASSIWFSEKLANVAALFGKTLTASVLLSNGTVKSGTATITSSASATFINDSALTVTLNTAGTFQLAVKATQTIRAVKLELGSYSTLINDTPPDYEKELDKCRWYFERIKASGNYAVFGVGVCANATTAVVLVPMHPKRNNNYTISKNGSFAILGTTSVTNLAKDNSATNYALNLGVTGTGFISASAALLRANNDSSAYIDVLNDL